MAPDKIYVAESLIKTPYGNEWSPTPYISRENTEFIRKDALLEWLKLAVECYSHPDTVNVVDTIRCEGKKWAFQDVINKIKSL